LYDPFHGHYRRAKVLNWISEYFQLPKHLIEVVVCKDFKTKCAVLLNRKIVAGGGVDRLEMMALLFKLITLCLRFLVWVLLELSVFLTGLRFGLSESIGMLLPFFRRLLQWEIVVVYGQEHHGLGRFYIIIHAGRTLVFSINKFHSYWTCNI
jgi:hypothetical protein